MSQISENDATTSKDSRETRSAKKARLHKNIDESNIPYILF